MSALWACCARGAAPRRAARRSTGGIVARMRGRQLVGARSADARALARLARLCGSTISRTPRIAGRARRLPRGARRTRCRRGRPGPGHAPAFARRPSRARRGWDTASPSRRDRGLPVRRPAGRYRAVPRLVELLRDRDPGVRREAIRALGELRAVEAVPDIADAIEAMGEWSNLLLRHGAGPHGPGGRAGRSASLLGAPGARSPAMIKGLLQVTGRIGVAADPAVIRSLASHDDPEVRVEAVRVLGRHRARRRSADVCLAAMDDAEWPVRAIAACVAGPAARRARPARLRAGHGRPRLLGPPPRGRGHGLPGRARGRRRCGARCTTPIRSCATWRPRRSSCARSRTARRHERARALRPARHRLLRRRQYDLSASSCVVGWRAVRRRLRAIALEDFRDIRESGLAPPISIVVPALQRGEDDPRVGALAARAALSPARGGRRERRLGRTTRSTCWSPSSGCAARPGSTGSGSGASRSGGSTGARRIPASGCWTR